MNYYWTVGMDYPYWWVSDTHARNKDSETDMGGLTPEEFHRWFDHAMPITEKEYDDRSVTLAQYMQWRRRGRC